MAKISLLNLDNDAINRAMVAGLNNAFKEELKDVLMQTAVQEIDTVIDNICLRLETRLHSEHIFENQTDSISLTWLLKKEAS